jgi:Fe-Mn family superoxide dismutase
MILLLALQTGHINHTLFWENLAPTKKNGGKLNDGTSLSHALLVSLCGEADSINLRKTGKLDELISKDFGSLDELTKRMNAAAAGIQGSGWAWLVSLSSSST